MLKKAVAGILLMAMLLTSAFMSSGIEVFAAGNVTNDTAKKIVTVTGGNMSMQFNYNKKMVVSSMELGGTTEVIDTAEFFHSGVSKDGVWANTLKLSSSPTVSVNGNTVTFKGISYSVKGLTVMETWTVTANKSDISLKVSKTYKHDASIDNQSSLLMSFKEKAFDVVQRTEDGGSFILLDPNRNNNRFLSNEPIQNHPTGSYYGNDKYSFYSANMDLLDKLNNKMLSITLTSNRNRATTISRSTDRNSTRALKVANKLSTEGFTFPSGTYLPLKVFQTEDFKPVKVKAGQNDIASYTFKAVNNLNKYYDLGSIPEKSGLDEYKLAQLMQDFGRASIVDKNVGMGDCDLSGIGTYETFWYSVNALGLQGAGNDKYLETLKNFVTFIKDYNYPIYNNGHIYARTYRDMTSWEGDNFMDGQAQFVAGIAQIYNLSGDSKWLSSVKDMTRSVLDWTLKRDTDGDGLIEAFNNLNTDNKSSDWNDLVSAAYENAYANVMLYKALVDWADIEESVLKDTARAAEYRKKAQLLKISYNKDTLNGGFWSQATNSFVYWRDKDDTVHGDVGYIFTNAYPIIFGMVDKQRAELIMNEYTKFMEENNLCLFPTQRSAFDKSEMLYPVPWKSFENGCIFVQQTYDMMGAYAKLGDTQKVLSMLKTATELYYKDNLWNTGAFNWDLSAIKFEFSEPWMSSGSRPAAGFYNFIIGIQPKYDKVIIDPCADASLNGVKVNYKLRGHDFTITLNDENTRNITTDGSIPVDCQWSNLPANVKYVITDKNLKTGKAETIQLSSGNEGRVGYTFTNAGQHTLTLTRQNKN